MRIEALFVYEPKDGFLFKLNPNVKILFMFFFSIAIFALNFFANFLFLIGIVILLQISKIPFRSLLKSLKTVYLFLLLAFLGNLFSYPGKVIFEVFGLPATYEGLMQGMAVSTRLINLLFISLAVSLTTSQSEITESLEVLLRPLSYIRINPSEIAFVLSLAIRALAILIQEVLELRKAYQAKGILREKMRFREQIMLGFYFLVPMILLTLKRSEEMALALTIRGYNPERKKIILRERKIGKEDLIFLTAAGMVFICGLLLTVMLK